MTSNNTESNSSLKAGGYRSRIIRLVPAIIGLAAIAGIIAIAAIWANSRDPNTVIPPPPTPTPMPTSTAVPPTQTPATIASTPKPTPQPSDEQETAPTDTTTPAPPDTPKPSNTPKPTNTPTHTPTSTPTHTPTPSPTPRIPLELEFDARAILIDDEVNQSDIRILSITESEWIDLSLGCGPREGNNPAMNVKGWILIFQHRTENKTWKFHVSETDDTVINCTDTAIQEQNTVNLTQNLMLDRASKVTFSRRNAKGEWHIDDPEVISAFAEALDTEIPIGNNEICDTGYQLEFEIDGKTEALNFFCDEPKDWYRIGGDQSLWQGTQGAMPPSILSLISPYLAAEPPPDLLPPSPEPEPQPNPTNLTQNLGLDRASRIIFSRRTAQGQWIIDDPEKIAEFAQVLDVELTLLDEKPCDTVFQLDFEIEGRNETLTMFCAKDWHRIGGDQPLWQETQATMPNEMLNLISPYLSAEPPPGLPPDPE